MDQNGAVQSSFPSNSGARKEKKKQAKDEQDRVRQAEKKKRRLEKALAQSAAIRSELEKKKQKKKEEQQRIDEEVAAIAEAVALHVLADEDSEEASKVVLNKDERAGFWQNPYLGLLPENLMGADGNIGFYLGWQRKDAYYQNNLNCCGDISYYRGSDSRERILGSRGTDWQHNDWRKLPHGRGIDRANANSELSGGEFTHGNGCSQWENFGVVNHKIIARDERGIAAEASAGFTPSQGVAALCIAEEARAEGRAAKMAAEAAITRILDKKYLVHKFDFLNKSKSLTRSGKQRDLPSIQLQETEMKARDKTLQV